MRDRFNFRIYDTKRKVMRTSDFFVTANGFAGELIDMNTSDDENTLFKMRCLVIAEKHFSELMQCTGLRDKSGKLIYEGDVVYKKGSKNWNKEKLLSKVIWSNDSAAFMISDENGLHQMPLNSNNIEVLGNIYENPELLKGECDAR